MRPELADALDGPDAYADLPECMRGTLSRREWLWLSDAEKGRFVQDETEPEGEN